MENELIVKVCEVTEQTYNFNEYIYRLVKCKAAVDDAFDTLIPIEEEIAVDNIIKVSKCKIVRIDYDLDYTRIAIRIDQFEICDEGTELSKYFNVPFIGMIKKRPDAKVTQYGPDKTKFIRILLQMRDADKKTFVIPLLGFSNNATALDKYSAFEIITGVATLKHKKNSPKYDLALYSVDKYVK
jgi:hypothetical protein